VLVSAENEHHNREKDGKHLTRRILYLLVAVSRNEHEHSAENCQNEYAQQVIVEFYGAYLSRFFADTRNSCA
jgi:hypothetical protein